MQLAPPNDSSYGAQWNYPKIGAVDGWDIHPGSYNARNGLRIAIVDTGVESTHPDIDDGRVKTSDGASCTSASGVCQPTPSDAPRDDGEPRGTGGSTTAGPSTPTPPASRPAEASPAPPAEPAPAERPRKLKNPSRPPAEPRHSAILPVSAAFRRAAFVAPGRSSS